MDAVEEWLRAQALGELAPGTTANAYDVIIELANRWNDAPPVIVVPYTGEPSDALEDFLKTLDGPSMIGLDPVVYPACTRCNHAWTLKRDRGVWAWYPDCNHKAVSCKLVHT